jgi:hypothetical protein
MADVVVKKKSLPAPKKSTKKDNLEDMAPKKDNLEDMDTSEISADTRPASASRKRKATVVDESPNKKSKSSKKSKSKSKADEPAEPAEAKRTYHRAPVTEAEDAHVQTIMEKVEKQANAAMLEHATSMEIDKNNNVEVNFETTEARNRLIEKITSIVHKGAQLILEVYGYKDHEAAEKASTVMERKEIKEIDGIPRNVLDGKVLNALQIRQMAANVANARKCLDKIKTLHKFFPQEVKQEMDQRRNTRNQGIVRIVKAVQTLRKGDRTIEQVLEAVMTGLSRAFEDTDDVDLSQNNIDHVIETLLMA